VVTVSFTGSVSLQFSDMSNSDATTFPTATTCRIPGALAVGSTCSLTISFRPSGAGGARSSQIVIRTTNAGTLLVNMSGSATQQVACSVIAWACTSSNTFGAIAYSPGSGASGWSNGYSTRNSAEARAIQECGGGDCFTAVWFQSQCGALARASINQWGWGLGGSQSVAESAALSTCAAR
jgi:serine/threonine-protein kinase